nr:unnamed protein product [Digitaria exilis]
MHERINELLVSTEAGPGSGRDVLSDDLYGERGYPVHLGRESHQRRDERERESAGGERPLGGAAEEEPGLGENRLRLLARGGGERGREAHGAVKRGGVGEGGRGAEGGLGRLGDGEREAVGARNEQGAGGGEGGEEGRVRAGELAAGGGLGHAERLLGAQRREAEAGGDGGDGGGGSSDLLVPVGGVGGVADEGGDAEVEAAGIVEGGLVNELRRAAVVDAAAQGADEHARVRVRDHRALAA